MLLMCFKNQGAGILLPVLLSTFMSLFGATAAVAQDPCEAWYEAAQALFAFRHIPDSLERRVEVARAGRRCYGDRAPERMNYFDFAEIASLTSLRRYEEALHRYDAFFERLRQAPDSLWLRSGYHNRGYLHFTMGHYGQAISDYARAVNYAATAAPLRRAQLMHDLGLLYQYVRDYPTAQVYFRESEAIVDSISRSENLSDARQLKTTLSFSRAGLILTQQGMNVEVDRPALNRAVGLLLGAASQADADGFQAMHVRILGTLAETYAYLGDRDAGFRYLRLATLRAAPLNSAALRIFIAHKTGLVYLVAGDYDAARRFLEQSTALAEQEHDLDYLLRGLTLLGLANELAGAHERAEEYYARAVDYTEVKRADLGTTPLSTSAFSAWQEPYRGLVRVRLARGKVTSAFQALEQTRARRLVDLRRESDLLTGTEPGTYARFDSLNRVLTALRDQMRRDTVDTAQRVALKNREAILLDQQSRFLHVSSPVKHLSVDSLRQMLARRNRVLLSYFVDEGDPLFHRRSRSYVFVVTKDSLAAVPLRATGASIQASLDEVSPILHADVWGINAINFRNTALKALYDQVYAPVADRIPDGAPLVIIPDGLLYLVPFSALVENETSPFGYEAASFLIKKHPISTEVAAALLLQPPPDVTPALDLRAFGKSRFSDDDRSNALLPPPLRTGPFPNLPAVSGELSELRSLFWNTETLLDEEATETSFFGHSSPPKLLHIASHTLLNMYSPLYSAIVLSPESGQGGADGMLYIYELRRQLPATHLVTLSGCSTARGTLYRGEGMSGLHYAFREMGVPSSLATLWLADDESIARLMGLYYRNLRDGMHKDVALQRAQLHFLAEAPPGLHSPFFWAAPVLYGSADPVPLTGRYAGLTARGWLVIVLLAFGVGITFTVRRFRR